MPPQKYDATQAEANRAALVQAESIVQDVRDTENVPGVADIIEAILGLFRHLISAYPQPE